MFLHPRCAFVLKLGIMKAYLESSTTNIYCLDRKNVLHYITINTTFDCTLFILFYFIMYYI